MGFYRMPEPADCIPQLCDFFDEFVVRLSDEQEKPELAEALLTFRDHFAESVRTIVREQIRAMAEDPDLDNLNHQELVRILWKNVRDLARSELQKLLQQTREKTPKEREAELLKKEQVKAQRAKWKQYSNPQWN